MWSLAETLENLSENLPTGRHQNDGIRSLFPRLYTGFSVTLLNNYVYGKTGDTAGDDIAVHFTVYADGAGRWRYSALISSAQQMYLGGYAVGFAFDWTHDGTAHGYMQVGHCDLDNEAHSSMKGTYVEDDALVVRGADVWITQNWPAIFASGCRFRADTASGNDEVELYASGTRLANDAGYPAMSVLAGASSKEATVEWGAGGTTEAGDGFPGGVNWPSPPSDDDDDDSDDHHDE